MLSFNLNFFLSFLYIDPLDFFHFFSMYDTLGRKLWLFKNYQSNLHTHDYYATLVSIIPNNLSISAVVVIYLSVHCIIVL